jgi:hypothetical protein
MAGLGSSSFRDGKVRERKKASLESASAVPEDTPWIGIRQPLTSQKDRRWQTMPARLALTPGEHPVLD